MPSDSAAISDVTLVCCHYLGGSALEWSGVRQRLDARFKVLSVDLPGFGDAREHEGYSVEQMVEHVGKLIRGRRSKHWVLVGHSMGAKVACVLARRAEDGAEGLNGLLSIIQVAGSPPSPEPMEDSKRSELMAMFSGDAASSLRDAERYVAENVGSPLDPSSQQRAVDDALRANRAAWLAWLEAGSKEDWASVVGLLRTPALIVTGEKDSALGTSAQRKFMLPHLQNCTVVELSGAAHLLPLERPAEIAALINRQVAAVISNDAYSATIKARYAEVIASSRVGEGTREALHGRLESDAGTALNRQEMECLRALANCVIPEVNRSFDLADRIGEMLSKGQGDGWRPALLPADRKAYQLGLAGLNAIALHVHSRDFPALSPEEQEVLLQQIAVGQLTAVDQSSETLLNARQMQVWFEDARADITRLYVAHPETLARIGYSGIANGGDGQAKSGFVAIGLGAKESWEPLAPPPRPAATA